MTAKPSLANTEKPFSKITLNIARSAADGKIQLENKGQGLLYARIVLSGIPETGSERTCGKQYIHETGITRISTDLLWMSPG